MTLNFILIGLYLLTVLFIGWRAGKKESPSDFVIASRDVGLFRTTASIFAVLGGEMLIAQTALSYTMGFSAFWFWGGIAIGMVLFGFAVPKIKTLGDRYNFINLSEYFGLKWGPNNRIFAALIVFVTFFGLLILQFMAIGNIVSPLFNISYPTIVLGAGLVVLAYLLLGGYKAVVNTDLLQAILMFGLLVGLIFFMDIGAVNFSQSIFAAGTTTFVSFLLIGAFFIFASADIWQRIFSARSAKIARNSIFLVTLLFVIFGFALTLIGVAAHNHFPGIDPNEAFFWGLSALLPTWLLGVGIVMVFATVMSTIDTEVYLLASSIAKDFVARTRKEISDIDLSKIIRIAMVLLVLVAMLIAIFVRDVVSTLFAIASFGLSLAPAVIGSLLWKLKPKAVFFSMLGGLTAFFALIIFGQFNPDNAVASLPAALIFLIIGQIIFKGYELEAPEPESASAARR